MPPRVVPEGFCSVMEPSRAHYCAWKVCLNHVLSFSMDSTATLTWLASSISLCRLLKLKAVFVAKIFVIDHSMFVIVFELRRVQFGLKLCAISKSNKHTEKPLVPRVLETWKHLPFWDGSEFVVVLCLFVLCVAGHGIKRSLSRCWRKIAIISHQNGHWKLGTSFKVCLAWRNT